MSEVQSRLAQWARSADYPTQAAALFNADAGSAAWLNNANALQQALASGNFSIRLEVRSDDELQGALGAFSATGTTNQPTIYLNAKTLASATSQELQAVLLEEFGHSLDVRLNGATDTQGDEGHAFAALLLAGNTHFSATGTENDHRTLTLDGASLQVEDVDPFNVAQIHFVPLPEPDVQTALTQIAGVGKVSGNINTVIAISATADNTVVIYDQWEDGYEANLNNPLQSTTQIWGDGNGANGIAPGTSDDIIHAGQTILLQNGVNPLSPITMDYDGRDKIGSTRAIAVTKAGWSAAPGTVLAGAISVIDAGNAGKDYIIPIGQNVDTVATGTNRLFEYTSAHIIATADNTVVSIDLQGDGVVDTTVTLQQGQTYMVNGGILAGARITATQGIGVYVIAGDVGSAYENRWFAMTPSEQWANSYYAPVGTTLAADPAYVILYNPNATAIDVYFDTATTTGKITVAARTTGVSGTNYMLMPGSAAHFYTKDNSKFYAVSAIDADATSNATHDWSYSLVPETYLTTKFVVGWGPGYDLSAASSTNASPVWVTATRDTDIYIDSATVTVKDSKGNVVTGSLYQGTTYEYTVSALESYRLFDADKDQSGLTVYTLDGTLITAAWGEDPSIAGAGTPYLDMGTTVLPFPDYVFTKTSAEASQATYGASVSNSNTQVELGEQIEYTISVTNRAVIDLYNINIKDAIAPSDAGTYVAGSTTLKVIRADGTVLVNAAIADDNVGNPFPLAKLEGGYTIADLDPSTLAIDGLKRGDQIIIKYRVQVRPDVSAALAAAGFTITNDAEMTGAPAGTGTSIPAKTTTNQTIISILGTSDGLITLTDAGYAGATSVIQEGSTIGIVVTDNDANLSATAINTLSVKVTNTTTGEIETVVLNETGVNTGVFRNTLATSTSTGAGDSNGTLLLVRGDNIRADYIDPIYGAGFDNPTNPGVAGDADNNIATGNANTAYASIPVPSQTKILYLSDDSTNNLDRVLPPLSDTTAAQTPLINAASGAVVTSISDDFSSANYTSGTGWQGAWVEVNDVTAGAGGGNIKISNGALYFKGGINGDTLSRGFTGLASAATLTFDIKNNSSNPYESNDKFYVYEQVGGVWSLVSGGSIAGTNLAASGTIDGTVLTTSAKTVTITLSAGATGIRFADDDANTSSDRVYVDNVKIVAGLVSTANATGSTDYPVGSATPAGQTFSFSGASGTADAITVDSLTLSLKKTGTTASTATVTIRSAWNGDVLWSGTIGTAALSTGYTDVSLAVSNLTLNRTGTYVIQVTSTSSGIVWQGNTTDNYATGNRIGATGAAASGDMRFALSGRESTLSSVSFSQNLSMATNFVMPAGGVIKVVTYVTDVTGMSDGTVSGISATLSDGTGSIASGSSPVYDSAAGTLTWSFSALGSSRTVAAGQSIKLLVSNAAAGKSFKIAYDSGTTRSRIELPTTSVINIVDADPVTSGVQEIGLFTNSLANGGTPLVDGFVDAGGVVYIRVKVADPFGDYDISTLQLSIDDGAGGATPISLSLTDANVVDAASDGRAYKTYEFAWQTTYDIGTYAIGVTANEGSEGTVTDSTATTFRVTETDLGTPSRTMFITGLGGVDAGAVYATGASAYLRVTDLDNSGRGYVDAVVNGYTVRLAETSTPGIFEADLTNPAVHLSNTNADATPQSYFTAMPAGRSLSVIYTDWNDSSDVSTDTIVMNTPPVAVDNTVTVGMDKQATGNAITDDNNGATAGGVDSDVDANTLTVTEVEGLAANLNDTITLASGARVFVSADGSYIYDPSSLTTPPSSGTPTVTDSFSYTIADGKGGTSVAHVNISISYVNPIVIDNQADTDGALVEFDVSGKFADITATVDVEYAITGMPTGLSIDPTTGLITGTIAAGASTATGTRTFNVSVAATELDANGNPTGPTTTRSFSWVVTNVAPTATPDTASVLEGGTLSGSSVVTNDADGSPDSDTLSVTGITTGAAASLGAVGAANVGSALTGVYGHLTVNANGGYTYIADTAAANALVAGATATDTFSYAITDGNGGTAYTTLVITITGVNDAAVIGGDAVGAVTEDAATPTLTDTGTLTITDADTGEASFQTTGITSSAGALGSLTISSSGVWSYSVSNALVQYLKAGETKVETFTVKALDGTTRNVVVTITGVNDAAVIGGDAVGAVTEDAATPTLTDTGTLTITDADTGEASFQTTGITSSAGALGSLSISSSGVWSYNVTNALVQYLKAGETKTETFTVKALDGTTHDVVITITGVNDAAAIGGDAVGAVTEDAATPTLTDTGTLTITDADTGEASFQTTGITSSAGALGSLTISSSGVWSYSVSNALVQYLKAGETKVETFTVRSSDGTAHDVLVTIYGVNEPAPTVSNPVVNEASPYAVFTITGQANLPLTLTLAGGTATGGGTDFGGPGGNLMEVSLDGGITWAPYAPGFALPANGVALARTPIVDDGISDNNETFSLTATNADGLAGSGTATIKDDGSGTVYAADGSPDTRTAPTDDRPLGVSSISVNEASPFAVFTVTGAAGQSISLALGNTATTADTDATLGTDTGNAGAGVALQIFSGGAWVDYIPGSLVTITADGTLLVRTAITNDTVLERAETFTLTATNSGGAQSTGIATIRDDGTGDVFRNDGTIDLAAAKDDDTPRFISTQPVLAPVARSAPEATSETFYASPITVAPAFSRTGFDPSSHVLAAVLEAREQQAAGVDVAGDIESRTPSGQMLMDVALYVLPAVSGARQSSVDAGLQNRPGVVNSLTSTLVGGALNAEPALPGVADAAVVNPSEPLRLLAPGETPAAAPPGDLELQSPALPATPSTVHRGFAEQLRMAAKRHGVQAVHLAANKASPTARAPARPTA